MEIYSSAFVPSFISPSSTPSLHPYLNPLFHPSSPLLLSYTHSISSYSPTRLSHIRTSTLWTCSSSSSTSPPPPPQQQAPPPTPQKQPTSCLITNSINSSISMVQYLYNPSPDDYKIELSLAKGSSDNFYLLSNLDASSLVLVNVPETHLIHQFYKDVLAPKLAKNKARLKYIIVTRFSSAILKSLTELETLLAHQSTHTGIVISNTAHRDLLAAAQLRNLAHIPFFHMDDGDSSSSSSNNIIVKKQAIVNIDDAGQLSLLCKPIPSPLFPDAMLIYYPFAQTIFTDRLFSAHVNLNLLPISLSPSQHHHHHHHHQPQHDLAIQFASHLEPHLHHYYHAIYSASADSMAAVLKTITQWYNQHPTVSLSYLAPAHGPVLSKHSRAALNAYKQWTAKLNNPSYSPTENVLVLVIFASAYGNTTSMAQAIATGVAKTQGGKVVSVNCETLDDDHQKDDDNPHDHDHEDENNEDMPTFQPHSWSIDGKRYAGIQGLSETIQRADAILIGSPTLGGHLPTPVETALGQILLNGSPTLQLSGAFGSFGWSGEAVDYIEAKLKNAGFKQGMDSIRAKFTPTPAIIKQCEEAGIQVVKKLQRAKLRTLKTSKRKNKEGLQATTTTISTPISEDSPTAKAMGRIIGSLCVITAERNQVQSAMLASWVSQATFTPPGITVAVAKDRAIESLLHAGDDFALNVMGSQRSAKLVRHFMRPFPPGADRFQGLEVTTGEITGAPLLKDAIAVLECSVVSRMEAGDHWIIYGQVKGGDVQDEEDVTAFHFRQTGARY